MGFKTGVSKPKRGPTHPHQSTDKWDISRLSIKSMLTCLERKYVCLR